ncbi:DUF768 domain-containing protein [Mesorhizobium sp. M7A.F.Ca.US.008.03.1.1]|nr:DUF768 domain-containing protein [Mesorhizobium sp. M7A.F.Ca.US.008.03.1.1]
MSTRGTNFLDHWIRNNVPETMVADHRFPYHAGLAE